MTIESCRDITTSMPNMYLDSVVPMVHLGIRFSDFSSFTASSRASTLGSQNGQKPMKINDFHGFSGFFENHVFFMENRSRQIDSAVILGHPGHAYLPGNDSQTLRRRPTRASSDCGWWVGVHSVIRFIKNHEFSGKSMIFNGFSGFLEIKFFSWKIKVAKSVL